MYQWVHTSCTGVLILVVDDDPVLVKLLATVLQQQGFRVISAPDMATAVRNVGRARPRLILLDINLPDGSGLDVLRQIRMALTGQVPVIAMSSTQDPALIARVSEAGAQAFLAKPIVLAQLWPTMDRLLAPTFSMDSPPRS